MTPRDLFEELFYAALRIRLRRGADRELYPTDRIQSPVHLSIGQEAVAVGACHATAPQRPVVRRIPEPRLLPRKGRRPQARCSPSSTARRPAAGSGKAGSMHLAAPEVGMMGASAVVASTTPHAVGAALAASAADRPGGRGGFRRRRDGGGRLPRVAQLRGAAPAAGALPVREQRPRRALALAARQAYRIVEQAEGYRHPVRTCRGRLRRAGGHERSSEIELRGRRRPETDPVSSRCETYRYLEHVGVGQRLRTSATAQAPSWRSGSCSTRCCATRSWSARFTPAIDARDCRGASRSRSRARVRMQADLLADVY